LEWWDIHHTRHPHIWKLAEEFLAISATSDPSERAFSSSGNILTLMQARLDSELVDDGVLLKEN